MPIYSRVVCADAADVAKHTKVESVHQLDPKPTWHVAGVILERDERNKYRGPDVMAWPASAIEAWQAKFAAEP